MVEAAGIDFDRLQRQWVEDSRQQLVTLAVEEQPPAAEPCLRMSARIQPHGISAL
jgi:hypothetical protein